MCCPTGRPRHSALLRPPSRATASRGESAERPLEWQPEAHRAIKTGGNLFGPFYHLSEYLLNFFFRPAGREKEESNKYRTGSVNNPARLTHFNKNLDLFLRSGFSFLWRERHNILRHQFSFYTSAVARKLDSAIVADFSMKK